MLKLLLDTCVWLDLAKDHRQQITLRHMQFLIDTDEISLLVPGQVIDEFVRNRERIIRESQQSLSSVIRRVKDTVRRFGDDERKGDAIAQLEEVDHKIATLSEAVSDSIDIIGELFDKAEKVAASDAAKIRCLDRALMKQAPFHLNKNSSGDALIIETFAEIREALAEGDRLVFVTHNTRDFSAPTGDNRNPHPDFGSIFDGASCVYSTNLPEILSDFDSEMFKETILEEQFVTEYRSLAEILAEERRLELLVWHNRHMVRAEAIEDGRIRLVPREEWEQAENKSGLIVDEIWEGALKAGEKVREEFEDDFGPWDDFEWGMVNGKLSAIRWILGYDWDMLDT